MAQYRVTAAFLVDTNATREQVRAEANIQFRDLAAVASRGTDWNGQRDATVTYVSDDLVIERLPDPEPTVTVTKSELEATIAACVAEALAERDAAQAGA